MILKNTNDICLFFIYTKLVDESTQNGEQVKRTFRRESLFDDYRNRSYSIPDDIPSPRIVLLPRRNVILFVA